MPDIGHHKLSDKAKKGFNGWKDSKEQDTTYSKLKGDSG